MRRYATIAQLAERAFRKRQVVGSNPTGGFTVDTQERTSLEVRSDGSPLRDRMTLSLPAQRVEAALRERGYTGTVLELKESTRSAAEAAHAVGCDVARIVKSLVFRTSPGVPVLVLTSGANRVNESALGERIGEQLGRADADFVREHTGFAIGGVPPLGHPISLRTLIDQDLMTHVTVWAAAGTPNALFEIPPENLARLCAAEVVRVT